MSVRGVTGEYNTIKSNQTKLIARGVGTEPKSTRPCLLYNPISRGYVTGDDTPHEPQVRMMLAGGGLGNSAVASSASASSGVSTANTNAVNDEVADATTINEVEDANVAKEEVDVSPVDCQSRVSGVKAVRG